MDAAEDRAARTKRRLDAQREARREFLRRLKKPDPSDQTDDACEVWPRAFHPPQWTEEELRWPQGNARGSGK